MKNEYDSKNESTEPFLRGIAGVLLAVVMGLVIGAMLVCAGGCATTRTRRNAGDIRLTDSYIAGELESAVSNFDGGIGRTIRESKGIADEIDRLEFLFNRYEQHALRLRNEVDKLRAKIEVSGEGDFGGDDNLSD